MTSFGWKRKAGEKVSREQSAVFEADAQDEEEGTELLIRDGQIDWLTLAQQKRKVLILEDATAKSKRLADEGAVLAGEERFWEAIKKWNECIELTPNDEKLHEMKAQALLQLNELFPAVQAAKHVVQLNPLWWIGYQTLGRTMLGLGEVSMAIRNFCKALHLNPAEQELWEEDLKWSIELRTRSRKMKDEAEQSEKDTKLKIVEMPDEGSEETGTQVKAYTRPGGQTESQMETYTRPGGSQTGAASDAGTGDSDKKVRILPQNYVQMRR